MGLKFRLMLAFSTVLVIVMTTAAFFFVRGAREDVRAELQSTRLVMEHFLDIELDALASDTRAEARFDLAALRTVRHLRVEYFDAQGGLVETTSSTVGANRPGVPTWFTALASPPPGSVAPVRNR